MFNRSNISSGMPSANQFQSGNTCASIFGSEASLNQNLGNVKFTSNVANPMSINDMNGVSQNFMNVNSGMTSFSNNLYQNQLCNGNDSNVYKANTNVVGNNTSFNIFLNNNLNNPFNLTNESLFTVEKKDVSIFGNKSKNGPLFAPTQIATTPQNEIIFNLTDHIKQDKSIFGKRLKENKPLFKKGENENCNLFMNNTTISSPFNLISQETNTNSNNFTNMNYVQGNMTNAYNPLNSFNLLNSQNVNNSMSTEMNTPSNFFMKGISGQTESTSNIGNNLIASGNSGFGSSGFIMNNSQENSGSRINNTFNLFNLDMGSQFLKNSSSSISNNTIPNQQNQMNILSLSHPANKSLMNHNMFFNSKNSAFTFDEEKTILSEKGGPIFGDKMNHSMNISGIDHSIDPITGIEHSSMKWKQAIKFEECIKHNEGKESIANSLLYKSLEKIKVPSTNSYKLNKSTIKDFPYYEPINNSVFYEKVEQLCKSEGRYDLDEDLQKKTREVENKTERTYLKDIKSDKIDYNLFDFSIFYPLLYLERIKFRENINLDKLNKPVYKDKFEPGNIPAII